MGTEEAVDVDEGVEEEDDGAGVEGMEVVVAECEVPEAIVDDG